MQVYHKDIKQLTQNEHKWMQRHIKVCNKMEKWPQKEKNIERNARKNT